VRHEPTTDLAMLERLAEPAGKDVVDVGCGGGALVRALSGLGARVVGVEISEEQLAPAIAGDDGARARYVVGRAQHLPLGDATADLVVFMRSLHHVPVADMDRALAEARRVVRPGGIAYVVEPLAQGDYFALMRLIEDEVGVRAAAQDALARAGDAGFAREGSVEYDVEVRFADLEAVRGRVVSVDPSRAALFDARRAELAEAFARLGEPGEGLGSRRFVQPMRADVLRAPA
jgi:predicted TPR repeat methyltransferase